MYLHVWTPGPGTKESSEVNMLPEDKAVLHQSEGCSTFPLSCWL